VRAYERKKKKEEEEEEKKIVKRERRKYSGVRDAPLLLPCCAPAAPSGCSLVCSWKRAHPVSSL
jgi:hypothetical protein